jgi:hypothetical protein
MIYQRDVNIPYKNDIRGGEDMQFYLENNVRKIFLENISMRAL